MSGRCVDSTVVELKCMSRFCGEYWQLRLTGSNFVDCSSKTSCFFSSVTIIIITRHSLEAHPCHLGFVLTSPCFFLLAVICAAFFVLDLTTGSSVSSGFVLTSPCFSFLTVIYVVYFVLDLITGSSVSAGFVVTSLLVHQCQLALLWPHYWFSSVS